MLHTRHYSQRRGFKGKETLKVSLQAQSFSFHSYIIRLFYLHEDTNDKLHLSFLVVFWTTYSFLIAYTLLQHILHIGGEPFFGLDFTLKLSDCWISDFCWLLSPVSFWHYVLWVPFWKGRRIHSRKINVERGFKLKVVTCSPYCNNNFLFMRQVQKNIIKKNEKYPKYFLDSRNSISSLSLMTT